MRFLATLSLCTVIMLGLIAVFGKRTPPASPSYCFTGIIWNKDTLDEMGLMWPCNLIHEVEGARKLERKASVSTHPYKERLDGSLF